MSIPKPDYAVMLGLKECPEKSLHTDVEGELREYPSWGLWATEKMRTHLPTKCPGCGLYRRWRPR